MGSGKIIPIGVKVMHVPLKYVQLPGTVFQFAINPFTCGGAVWIDHVRGKNLEVGGGREPA